MRGTQSEEGGRVRERKRSRGTQSGEGGRVRERKRSYGTQSGDGRRGKERRTGKKNRKKQINEQKSTLTLLKR